MCSLLLMALRENSTDTEIKGNILTHVANTMWAYRLLTKPSFLVTNQPTSLVTGDATPCSEGTEDCPGGLTAEAALP